MASPGKTPKWWPPRRLLDVAADAGRPGGGAPLGVSFSGGGPDMPFYYTEHGGAVLASTINRYTTVTLAPGSDHGAVSLASLDYDLTVKYRLDEKPAYDGVLDLAKAAIRRLVPADFN